MPAEFSETELSIIGNMMISKTNKAIADLLERPLYDVAQVIADIKLREDIESFQDKIDAKNAARKLSQANQQRTRRAAVKNSPKRKQETEAKRLAREQKEIKDALKRQRLNRDEKSRVDREKARGYKFQTKVIDYSKLHTLRIDRKTVIYIQPGQDEQKAKADFLKTYKRSFKADEGHVDNEQVTKECRRCKKPKLLNAFYKAPTSLDNRDTTCADCRQEMEELRKRQKNFK